MLNLWMVVIIIIIRGFMCGSYYKLKNRDLTLSVAVDYFIRLFPWLGLGLGGGEVGILFLRVIPLPMSLCVTRSTSTAASSGLVRRVYGLSGSWARFCAQSKINNHNERSRAWTTKKIERNLCHTHSHMTGCPPRLNFDY